MRYRINLIGEKKRGFFDSLLYFFMNYLRYILVITQLVVIGVLFFRFRVDQNIIDLKDSIDQKKQIVAVVAPLLGEAEKVDYQVKEVKTVLQAQSTFASMTNYLLSQFPASITLTAFSIEADKVSLTGSATNPKDIQLFYTKLKKDANFAKVELSNLKRDRTGYAFILELSGYKGK